MQVKEEMLWGFYPVPRDCEGLKGADGVSAIWHYYQSLIFLGHASITPLEASFLLKEQVCDLESSSGLAVPKRTAERGCGQDSLWPTIASPPVTPFP